MSRLKQGCLLLVMLGTAACGSDDAGASGGASGSGAESHCLAGSVELTETKVTDAPTFNTLLLDFDAKNTGSKGYDIEAGSKPISMDFVVTTSGGAKYESTAPLTASKIGAGATAAVVAMAEYGAGKTYESYTVQLRCR